MSLPVVFIVLASLTLLGALSALFVSLRAAFGGTSGGPLAVGSGLSDRAALEDEKNALLRALKDLEYEHEVGKISDADYARLEHAYRLRAKQVLLELDRDLSPYVSQAEALVARALGETGKQEPDAGEKRAKKKAKAKAEPVAQEEPQASEQPKPEPEKEPESPGDEPASEPERPKDAAELLVCAKCETKNDPDARFCKRCASPLGPEEPT